MIKKITQSITFFQELFSAVFTVNSQNAINAIEVLLMLASGHIFDIFTPNHSRSAVQRKNRLVQTLCIDKNKVEEIHPNPTYSETCSMKCLASLSKKVLT